MPYTFNEYLNALKESLINFDKNPQKICSSEVDEKAYNTQRSYLDRFLELGFKVERTSSFFYPVKKMNLGKEMKTLVKTIIGTEDDVPNIAGERSFEFAKNVYLPHLKRGEQLKLHPIEIRLASMIGSDLEQEKIETRKTVKLLESKLDHYKELIEKPDKELIEVPDENLAFQIKIIPDYFKR